MNKTLIILLFFIAQCICSTKYIYTYQTHFKTPLGSFKAGENIITIAFEGESQDDLLPQPLYGIELTSQSKITNSFIKSFYSVEDSTHILMYKDMSIRKVHKSIQEKNKTLKIYDSIVKEDSIYYNRISGDEKKSYTIFNPYKSIYNALGIIFNFSKKFNCLGSISTEYIFNEYRKGKITPIYLTMTHEEKIQSPYGEKNCFILSTKQTDDKMQKGDMKIWIAKDSQDPIKVETKTKNGLLTLLLESIE